MAGFRRDDHIHQHANIGNSNIINISAPVTLYYNCDRVSKSRSYLHIQFFDFEETHDSASGPG